MERHGPIDDFSWSDSYAARVLSPLGDRLQGYEIEADLAQNYSFPEIVLTALTGAVPEPSMGHVFGRVLSFMTVISPGSAPCHAAGLSRLMGAHSGAVLATACLGLIERARSIVKGHQNLIDWLDRREGPCPRSVKPTAEDQESVGRLRDLLPPEISLDIVGTNPTRAEALIVVLRACGIQSEEQLNTVFVLAGLAPVIAEAMAVPPLVFPMYPLKLPEFQYVEEEKKNG